MDQGRRGPYASVCGPQPEGAGAHPSSAAAEPFVPSRGDPAWNTGCDRHMAVHDRLDIIEETVEKTVEHLETEVKGLLGQLEELAWNLPPGSFSPPTPDLFGDDGFGAPEPELPGSWK
ncbi:placenta-specific protein 9 [Crocuta crocuta]